MYIYFIITLLVLFLGRKIFYFKKEHKELKNRHVVVIGGSSGIGKSFAILAAKKGAHVTIIARNIDRLAEAITEIKLCASNINEQMITYVSVDVSNFEDIDNNLSEIEETVGPIYMLVNCAGFAECGELENVPVKKIQTLVNVNLLGSIYSVKAILPKFKQRKEGIIVLTASQVGLFGMYGYSVYSSCKFALRGLAESVFMEVRPYGISVTLALPPDTETPGFEKENISKPQETLLISESGQLFQPDEVAKRLMDDALAGKFFSYVGFESFILTTLCVGMSPFSSFGQVIYESLIIGSLRLLSSYYVIQFHKIVKRCYLEKTKNIK